MMFCIPDRDDKGRKKDASWFVVLVSVHHGPEGAAQRLCLWNMNQRLFILWPTGNGGGGSPTSNDLLPPIRPYLLKGSQSPQLRDKLSKQEPIGNIPVQSTTVFLSGGPRLLPLTCHPDSPLGKTAAFQRVSFLRSTNREPQSPWNSTSSILCLPQSGPLDCS